MATPETVLSSVVTEEVRFAGDRGRVSAARVRTFANTAEIFIDFVATVLGVYVTYFLELAFDHHNHSRYSPIEVAAVASVVALMTVLLLGQGGAYSGAGSCSCSLVWSGLF